MQHTNECLYPYRKEKKVYVHKWAMLNGLGSFMYAKMHMYINAYMHIYVTTIIIEEEERALGVHGMS